MDGEGTSDSPQEPGSKWSAVNLIEEGSLSNFPKSVNINEEGPREGFQIEKRSIPARDKIELIDALSETGVSHIQVTSFVNPKQVPGAADADEVVNGLKRYPGVTYTGFWLNAKGLQRALAHRDKLTITGSIRIGASEPFMLRNQRTDYAQNIAMQHQQVEEYKANQVLVTDIGVMAAFGCNFQGDIPIARVIEAIRQAREIADVHGVQPTQVRLSDTMAWATPVQIRRVVGAVQDAFPYLDIILHLHDTRGMAVANAFAGLEMGVTQFDSAVAGLGGCPFAGHAGAAGNICTEDLVFLCEEMGVETGINLDRLIEVGLLAERIFGRQLPGSVMHGGTLKQFRSRTNLACAVAS